MKKKTQAEILENKLGNAKIYRLLMICFIVISIFSSTFAIISAVRFTNYKNGLVHPNKIRIQIETKDDEISQRFKIEENEYGGTLADGSWFGQTLANFLERLPFFTIVNGFIQGIHGSETNADITNNGYYWMIYSPTDSHSIEHPNETVPVGIGDMILQNYNIYYFALEKVSKFIKL